MIDTSAWPEQARELWRRLCAHPLEDDTIALDFSARLGREQGWNQTRTRQALEEYRRFCFLAVISDGEVTPSVAVDQVWHLHLQYTRDYWQQFCPHTLGTQLHHGPTRGGHAEGLRFRDQYAHTLAMYERWFGSPPRAWWPDDRERFHAPQRFVWTDSQRYWRIPKPQWRRAWLALPLLTLALWCLSSPAWALSANPLDWPAKPFLALYIALLLGTGILCWLRLRSVRVSTGSSIGAPESYVETAYLAGGPQRAVDAAIVDLLAQNALVLDPGSKRLRVTRQDPLQEPAHAMRNAVLSTGGDPRKLLRRSRTIMAPVALLLARRRLWMDADAVKAMQRRIAVTAALLLALGLTRLVIGMARAEAVGYLILLLILTSVLAAVALLSSRWQRTTAGDRMLHRLKQRHARLVLSARTDELPLAVALGGTVVLATTPYADYHRLRVSPSGSDSGGSDGDGDGDGGGGGCGGCGD